MSLAEHLGHAHEATDPGRAGAPELAAVRLARWLGVAFSVPASMLALEEGLRAGATSPWLTAIFVTVILTTVALFALRRAPVRTQAAVICGSMSTIAVAGVLHFGPILGSGAVIGTTCVCWTFFFGARAAAVATSSLLAFVALVGWADVTGAVRFAGASASPRSADAWMRTWLTAAGTVLFVCGMLAALRHRERALLAEARASERRIARLLVGEMEARRDAEDAARARDEFLTLASHELRTPLTSLKLAVQGIGRSDGRPDARLTDNVERQVRRLERLVGSMLDVAPGSGPIRLSTTCVDLADLARDAVASLALEAQRAGSELTVSARSAVRAECDRARIEELLEQLVSNAIKFGRGAPIEIAVDGDDDAARITVRDHGTGMAPADLEHAFERFHRGVSWRHFGGLGLGLHLARAIADAHGGTLHAESALGDGSTFTLALPRAAESAIEERDAPTRRGSARPRAS